jgi:transcriptional regulator with XRE-family HTH domain
MTDIQRLLSENLKRTRNALGLSQAKVAERCSISTSFVGEIEIGRKFPSPKTLEALAEALNLKPYQLFFEDEDWKQFDRFEVLTALSSALKVELAAQVDLSVARFLGPGNASS